jgi:quercetin dioxygenase-like cupin family protein
MLDITSWTDPKKVEQAYDGIERRVLAYNDDIMLVHYTVERDAVFPGHEHDETQQAVYVISGEVELRGDTETRLAAGDSFVVGPNIEHGIRGVAPRTELVDAFSPPIAEYER